MTKDIAFDIKQIVEAIDTNIYGTYNAGLKTIETCDVKYSRAGKYLHFINDQGALDRATISSVTNGNEIMHLGNAVPVQNPQFFLQQPYFVSGTHMSANREWSVIGKDLFKKTPIIWLLETTRTRKFGRESVYDYSSDVRIFFLDETNPSQYKSLDHLEQVVNPMHKLIELFLQTIASNKVYLPVEDYELITFTRFGVEKQDGIFQNILDANLSGVELRLTLTKYKENCNC